MKTPYLDLLIETLIVKSQTRPMTVTELLHLEELQKIKKIVNGGNK